MPATPRETFLSLPDEVLQGLAQAHGVDPTRYPNRDSLIEALASLPGAEDLVPEASRRRMAYQLDRLRPRQLRELGERHWEGAVWDSLGYAHHQRGDYAQAIACYERAIALSRDLADRFNLPVISFVDTPGAYPGVGAEQRGQAEAIARSTQACLALHVPFVCVITGEGMSGGVVVVGVIHAASHRGVVVAENGMDSLGPHERTAFVGAGPVTHRVAQADAFVDAFI